MNSADFASCGTLPPILTDLDLDNLEPAGLQPATRELEQRHRTRDRILETMRQPVIVLNDKLRAAATGSVLSGNPALNAAWNPITYSDLGVLDFTTGFLNGNFTLSLADGLPA